ncbi:hypothetical protein QBC38DRAFT_155344 [Podospora fimiseda]|uniref:Uncharacterized protein n=1 Tax=Podospora fimiseda TaxID=252190 RepID=A0AAN6YKT8_9PEZI|nr:hypothetical protein QBC38DRAFT_155344 [Podospora fimiseda]
MVPTSICFLMLRWLAAARETQGNHTGGNLMRVIGEAEKKMVRALLMSKSSSHGDCLPWCEAHAENYACFPGAQTLNFHLKEIVEIRAKIWGGHNQKFFWFEEELTSISLNEKEATLTNVPVVRMKDGCRICEISSRLCGPSNVCARCPEIRIHGMGSFRLEEID